MLSALTELTLENNPIEKDKNLSKILKEKFPALKSDLSIMSPKG